MIGEQLEGGIEGVTPTLTGIVRLQYAVNDMRGLGDIRSNNSKYQPIWRSGTGYITTDEGDQYFFNLQMCKDDTFDNLKDGMRVTFNKVEHNLKGEPARSLVAQNIAIDTSEDAIGILVPKTENNVENVLGGTK